VLEAERELRPLRRSSYDVEGLVGWNRVYDREAIDDAIWPGTCIKSDKISLEPIV